MGRSDLFQLGLFLRMPRGTPSDSPFPKTAQDFKFFHPTQGGKECLRIYPSQAVLQRPAGCEAFKSPFRGAEP